MRGIERGHTNSHTPQIKVRSEAHSRQSEGKEALRNLRGKRQTYKRKIYAKEKKKRSSMSSTKEATPSFTLLRFPRRRCLLLALLFAFPRFSWGPGVSSPLFWNSIYINGLTASFPCHTSTRLPCTHASISPASGPFLLLFLRKRPKHCYV